MRVTGGSLKGRRLDAPSAPGLRPHASGLRPHASGLRPSSDRLRQTLFNILAHGRHAGVLDGARVLDGFAGTGALGIEALSRGAAHAVFLERDRAALAALRRTLAALDLEEQATVMAADLTAPPSAPPGRAATLVLLDPPYASGLAAPALLALDRAGWIAPDALIVLEAAARDRPQLPPGFALADTRRVGDSALLFILRAS